MITEQKKPRRTLKLIEYYPTTKEILDKIQNGTHLVYKNNMQFYHARDKALVALLYLLAPRVSEALRLTKKQFKPPGDTGYPDRIVVQGIKLSKSKKKGKPRKAQFREEGWLPLKGPREPFTQIVMNHTEQLSPEEKLFPFDRTQAYRITNTLTGYPPHWFRAFGEDYLYDEWDHDILAVADYIKVDARTLQEYLRRRYQKYGVA